MKLTILHNPKCSKSREAIEILKKNDINYTEHLYLQNPPSEKVLRFIWEHLSEPKEMVRVKEEKFREIPFSLESKEVVIEKLTTYPQLIERPILFTEKSAIVGRPTGRILDFLKKEIL